MSRIGGKPVKVLPGVQVKLSETEVTLEGKLGKLTQAIPAQVTVTLDQATSELKVARKVDDREGRAFHGLTRALLANMMIGVTKGYEKKLEIVGVGYLAAIAGKTLQLRVGYANEVHRPIPEGLKVTCPDQTHVIVQGLDKQMVGQFAAEVRAVRKPEPYKGKGIRYDGEVVRRKAGKAMTK
jgi:large subunit ribosomal protein L6